MNSLERLLELQGLDTRIAQLEHRRAQIPEREELRLLEQDSVALAERLVAAESLHHELERRQKRYDDDLNSVLAKREQENRLLYSGQVTAMRELQSLEEEVAALGRRQRVVEDKLLEVMEQLEPSSADLEDLQRRGEDVAERTDAAQERLAAATAQIDEESREVRAERDGLAADISADLLERYERLRRQIGGVAVARLEGTSCLGCHLTLPLMEVDRLRRLPPVGEAPPGATDKGSATCPSCGRILVF